MATSTTPVDNPPSSGTRHRSTSRTRLPSRPTTPLRPPSRTSLRASQTTPSGGASTTHPEFPLASLEPAFAELSDSMADLEANFMHLQLLHESLGRFNENFGAFLYGMNMSAFCVDFPEAPIPQSFARSRDSQAGSFASPTKTPGGGVDTEATFLTNDTSFVENPPTSGKPASKYATPKAARDRQTMGPGRGGAARGRGAGTSGIARSTSTRGGAAAGASRGASGIGRGVPRGRGVVR